MKDTAVRKRRQVPEGYLVVGVDPHKKRHAAVAPAERDRSKVWNIANGVDYPFLSWQAV